MIPFPTYANIKDNYCCLYLGNAPEYIVALTLLKPQIESQLPGLKFHIAGRDEFSYLDCIPLSQLDRSKFAYIRELRNDYNKHSIFALMQESGLKINPIAKNRHMNKGICLICPEGIEPTKSKMINIDTTGYTPIVLGSDVHKVLDIKIRPEKSEKFKYIEEASWIIGVENEYLYLGAAKGIRTTLVKTGIGHDL